MPMRADIDLKERGVGIKKKKERLFKRMMRNEMPLRRAKEELMLSEKQQSK